MIGNRFLKYSTFKIQIFLLAFCLSLLCFLSPSQGQEVEVWKYSDLHSYIEEDDNPATLKVINFWATWCAPCIKELPYYEEARTSYQNDVEILLVSLDFVDKLNSKVIPLLERKNIKTKAVLLDEGNYNEWIEKVDIRWTGALPATIFITDKGEKVFFEQEFKREELFALINDLKPKN